MRLGSPADSPATCQHSDSPVAVSREGTTHAPNAQGQSPAHRPLRPPQRRQVALLNAITRQDVSIVSDVAGTTTDPVEKPMELLPLGPVLFIDTAGRRRPGRAGRAAVGRTRRSSTAPTWA